MIVFNGKDYSLKKKILLQRSADSVRELGVIPHLATILIGENEASLMYTNLKKKFIESLGCQVDIYNLSESTKHADKVTISDVELLIKSLNEDETVHGVMVQMPLPKDLLADKDKIIKLISPKKDVDGLQLDSQYLHPTSKAVMEILAIAILETKIDVLTVCVIGASGMVGRPLVGELKKLGYIVLETDINTQDLKEKTLQADVVISAAGVMNLVTPDMVNESSIVIDVGAPNGDVVKEVYEKVSFISPVPGGVGPVTITCLAENLILSAQSTINS